MTTGIYCVPTSTRHSDKQRAGKMDVIPVKLYQLHEGALYGKGKVLRD